MSVPTAIFTHSDCCACSRQVVALLAISLRSGDRPQLGVELPSPDRHLGVEF